MREIIEASSKHLIICDNKKCDYVVENKTRLVDADISEYLNKPCPRCGENLLTEEDYLNSLKVIRTIKFINRWFGWLRWFVPKNAKPSKMTIHSHKGINITTEKPKQK